VSINTLGRRVHVGTVLAKTTLFAFQEGGPIVGPLEALERVFRMQLLFDDMSHL
jgi:hypothetical protein